MLVRSDLKGQELGRIMMEKMVRYARDKGIGQLSGLTMPSNRGMIALARKVGFEVSVSLEDNLVSMVLPLTPGVDF